MQTQRNRGVRCLRWLDLGNLIKNPLCLICLLPIGSIHPREAPSVIANVSERAPDDLQIFTLHLRRHLGHQYDVAVKTQLKSLSLLVTSTAIQAQQLAPGRRCMRNRPHHLHHWAVLAWSFTLAHQIQRRLRWRLRWSGYPLQDGLRLRSWLGVTHGARGLRITSLAAGQ